MQWCIVAVCAALAFLPLSLADNSTTTIAPSSSSTATIAPSSSSTVAVDVSTPTPTTESPPECKAMSTCHGHEDCHDGGRCIGAFVGTCNCNACVNFWRCSDDSSCGGLRGACDTAAGICKCIDGLKKHGYATYFGALQRLCNKKTCGNSTDTCHGLSCNAGRCTCGHKTKKN